MPRLCGLRSVRFIFALYRSMDRSAGIFSQKYIQVCMIWGTYMELKYVFICDLVVLFFLHIVRVRERWLMFYIMCGEVFCVVKGI